MKFKYIRPFFLTLVAFVSPFIFTSCNNGSQSLKITMIDVGQGSSTFITFPDKTTMLIDSGLDANKFKTWLSCQYENKNKVIDYFLTTHPDDDHIHNSEWVYDNWQVNNSLLPFVLCEDESAPYSCGANQPVPTNYKKMQTWQKVRTKAKNEPNSNYMFFESSEYKFGECSFKIFEPPFDWYPNSNWNEYSPIMFITFNNTTICMTGDAELEKETWASQQDIPQADIYFMGHHGSKTSSNDCFIDKIKPSVSLYSSYDPDGTKYGFPSIYSLNRIKNYSHHDIYGSEYNGNINIEVNKNGYIMKDDNNRNLIKTTSGWDNKGGKRIGIDFN